MVNNALFADTFPDGSYIADYENVSIPDFNVSGNLQNITLLGDNKTGYIITKVLNATYLAMWHKLMLNDSITAGSNITYRILDANDRNATLCEFNSTDANSSSGFSVYYNCSRANAVRRIRLYAFLRANTTANKPVLHKWNLTWETGASYLNVTLLNRTGSGTMERLNRSKITVYENETSNLVCDYNSSNVTGRIDCVLNQSKEYDINTSNGVNMYGAPVWNQPKLLYYLGTTLRNLTISLINSSGGAVANVTLSVYEEGTNFLECSGLTNIEGKLQCELNASHRYDVNSTYGVWMFNVSVPNALTVQRYLAKPPVANLTVMLRNSSGSSVANKTVYVYNQGATMVECSGNTSNLGFIRCELNNSKRYDVETDYGAKMYGINASNNLTMQYYSAAPTMRNVTVVLLDASGSGVPNVRLRVYDNATAVIACEGNTSRYGNITCELNASREYDLKTDYGVRMYDVNISSNPAVNMQYYSGSATLKNLTVILRDSSGALVPNANVTVFDYGTSNV
ncbi:MAG: hypothetical protein KKE96_00565, partial [Candidatus Altiarchaeota archaeon]|nr:hypothetical protein [Candidatus Altiarchaeota archaeon]